MNKENEYKAAFNTGYTLAKHEPGLLHSITKNLDLNNDYLEGLFEGKEQYAKEQIQEKLNDLDNIRNHSQEKENDLERDF